MKGIRGRGRPRKVVAELLSQQVCLKIMEEEHVAIQEAARRKRTSVNSWIRGVVDSALREQGVIIFGLDKTTGNPNKSSLMKTVRRQGAIVRMDEIEHVKQWEPIRTFIKRYNEVCDRHEELKKTQKILPMTTSSQSIGGRIFFNRAVLKKLMVAFNEQGFDGEAVLDALDSMSWYNGDDPAATWGVADLTWMMIKKKTKEEPNWGRLLTAWRKEHHPRQNTKDLAMTPMIRSIVIELSKKVDAIEGTSDWQRIQEFVQEKCKKHGTEFVRSKLGRVMIGPLGYQEFVRSFD